MLDEGLGPGEGEGRGTQGTWKEGGGACSKKPVPGIENSAAAGKACNGAGLEEAESALGGGACSKAVLTSLIFRSCLCTRQQFFFRSFHGLNGL